MSNIKKGTQSFYVGEDEKNPDAEIGYTFSEEGDIVIDHTVVSESLQGQGLAGKLVERVVEKARQEGKKINPLCSYAQKKLEETPNYHDVLKN
ncbi:GNAT family N-acetyltransferase [Oceanobacillus manasiensis]|uniref:GNAT family N-acetyltransferase n=1 Tax=Oceanobacillus manasiensis TaxID=586413 RepID=UPI0005A6C945|nr:GNAT family N-acetyltransferase [Oceanobacillus manasiensis]